MPERLNGAVSKTVGVARRSWVRIPPPPLEGQPIHLLPRRGWALPLLVLALIVALSLGALPARAATVPSSGSETLPDPTLPGLAGKRRDLHLRATAGFGRCSGTSVNAPNLSVVFTAGHCVLTKATGPARKWVFVPGYHHGERPFGTFTAKWLGTTRQWLASENFNFDVGAAVVCRNERGQRLAAAVGGDGIAWGLSPPGLRRLRLPGRAALQRRHPAALPPGRLRGPRPRLLPLPGPLDLAVQCDVSPAALRRRLGDRRRGAQQRHHQRLSRRPTTDSGPTSARRSRGLFARAARVK